eukprot:gnl/TRDRNA2_/TRDRNA2_177655_c0_seq25.p1 gnl/TRDRNA2_/TRDRNA2_177655_c0~~gnl/TRDRNA2_/TRDRNA2_177655_c0_seq25.p1  ORF type:complete len:515 (-),score=122.64 gnl/TRDRNA2_/TRDRNA2_177655_c0_seq25:416-1960(-)
MAPAKSFQGRAISTLVAEVAALPEEHRERCVLLAKTLGNGATVYSLPFDIAAESAGKEAREAGLKLLWARAVSVAAGIVGTSKLGLVCSADATLEFLRQSFQNHPGLVRMLESTFGPFELRRAAPAEVPKVAKTLPSQSRSNQSAKTGAHATGSDAVVVGVDYGRSDVKVAVLRASTGDLLATVETKWWRLAADGSSKEFVDPAKLGAAEDHLRVMSDAARKCLEKAAAEQCEIVGLGLSAAGVVQGGEIRGVPPAFGGVNAAAAAPILERLSNRILEELAMLGCPIAANAPTITVNDGDAMALDIVSSLGGSNEAGGWLCLSLGTGLAGGLADGSSGDLCGGVLELGKVVIAVPDEDAPRGQKRAVCGGQKSGGGQSSGALPRHDILGVEGCAQGLSGTQRSLFNALAAKGGERLEDKAQQRAKLIELQKTPDDAATIEIFEELGDWLAVFVSELETYVNGGVAHVRAGGKMADGPLGAKMLERAQQKLSGVRVAQAEDSVFGQAVAVAASVH